jgi:hypothetical protein
MTVRWGTCMNGQYYILNNFNIVGPHGVTPYYIVANHIFGPVGPNGAYTYFWINDANNRIVAPNGADSGFWIEDGRIYGTGQAPWLS